MHFISVEPIGFSDVYMYSYCKEWMQGEYGPVVD